LSEIAFASATRQAQLIKRGEVSPVELVTEYLERIDLFDGDINSFVTVTAERALEEARRAQRSLSQEHVPPFVGVPITIKDLTEVEGVLFTASVKPFAGKVGMNDAASVTRIREAGFIILGKTNTPELGTLCVTESELNGVCRNPWDPSLTAGGSSGGAAAGVAAGFSPVAHGSDGGGSIRIPASCCGLYGLKPSRGRVSSGPGGGDVAGLGVQGPLARTVEDAAGLLDVMAGYELGDPHWAPPPERPFRREVGASPGRLRIAVTTEAPNFAPVSERVVAATTEVAEMLEGLGHIVEEAAPEWADPEITPLFVTLWQARNVDGCEPHELEPINRALIESGAQTSSLDYVSALSRLQSKARKIVTFWRDYDLLLTPTLALEPVPVGWVFESDDPWEQFARMGLFIPFTPLINLTGQPACSLPLHWTEEGIPIGVQLIGRPAGEAVLLRVSAQLEEARPWAQRRPHLLR
jgi:amidase